MDFVDSLFNLLTTIVEYYASIIIALIILFGILVIFDKVPDMASCMKPAPKSSPPQTMASATVVIPAAVVATAAAKNTSIVTAAPTGAPVVIPADVVASAASNDAGIVAKV